jgi:methylphosphotriester-DNA--protein-cysteine methyltransferase
LARAFWVMILAAVIWSIAAEKHIDAFPFTTVYINGPMRLYHRMSCVALKGGHPKAISVANAKKRGYNPCIRCQPPEW